MIDVWVTTPGKGRESLCRERTWAYRTGLDNDSGAGAADAIQPEFRVLAEVYELKMGIEIGPTVMRQRARPQLESGFSELG